MQHFLKVAISDSIFFEILTHFGTSIAIFLVFFRDISELARQALAADRQLRLAAWHYIGCILIGSIPVGLAGLFFYDHIVAFFGTPSLAATMLLITGVILYSAKSRTGGDHSISIRTALLIGLVQSLALMPGISRSGITIVTGLWLGLKQREAGRFSFLLALPALLGASFLDFIKIDSLAALPLTMPEILVSLVVSIVIGFVSLKILLDFIRRGELHYFAYYCLAAGLVSLIMIGLAGY